MKNILFDLAEKAKKTPNKAAFIFLNRNTNSTEINQISFKELDEKSSRAATLPVSYTHLTLPTNREV